MIREFIQYQLQVRGLSPRTCEEYQKNLVYFVAWAQPRQLRWSEIWKTDIDCWTKEMKANGLEAATIRLRISILRVFFDWLCHEGKLQINPVRYCQTPKLQKKLPKPADINKIDVYLGTPAYTPIQQEMHIAVAIMLETGIRLHELTTLQASDFNKQTSGIRIHGKGSKDRLVFYGRRSKEQLNKYKRNSKGYIITQMDDTTLRYEMYREVGPYCPNIYPHQLRHTFATAMLNRGMDLKTLSVLLGHDSVKTTEIYARASEERIQHQYSQFNI